MSIASTPDTRQNKILKALPIEEYQRLAPHLKTVEHPQGHTLYHQGDNLDYVYFPNSGMVSLVTVMKDGASVEVGIVGRSGMVGISTVLGDHISPNDVIVQIADGAVRLSAKTLGEHLKDGGELQRLLHRYIVAHLKQTAQTAACNRNHHIGERLAYWLLMCQESVGGDRLKLTQEFIAQMLGVRRAGVTDAAVTLQSLGLIKYRRGDIEILDRPGLEEFACECFRAVSDEFERLIGGL
jgi:CRP-like cAMP-binding protein